MTEDEAKRKLDRDIKIGAAETDIKNAGIKVKEAEEILAKNPENPVALKVKEAAIKSAADAKEVIAADP